MCTGASKELSDAVILSQARQWLHDDPDSVTREFVENLITRGDLGGLRAAFQNPLRFGTAGIRGPVGAGPARINLVLIHRLAAALGRYLLQRAAPGQHPLVIIGYDARPESQRFAQAFSLVLAGLQLRTFLTSEHSPTPCISFAVRYMKASAGVVVTASHNPRGDNGIKIFDNLGAQIVSPWDEMISKLMQSNAATSEHQGPPERVEALPHEVSYAYFQAILRNAESLVPDRCKKLMFTSPPMRFAYSALHGVAYSAIQRVVKEGELSVRLLPVESQVEPDGLFPSLRFPNPEEKGALDLLLQKANQHQARIALANDPDGDRFALCLPLSGPGEALSRLSGDDLGLIFAHEVLTSRGQSPSSIFSTIVSSPSVEILAQGRGARFVRTLTGFKWLCHAAAKSPDFAFAYEEALGYCFAGEEETTVFDKDGIAATAIALRMALKYGGGEGLTLQLHALRKEVGHWGSYSSSRSFDGSNSQGEIAAYMSLLRATPPRKFGELIVQSHTDYANGSSERPWYLGEQDLLQFDLLCPREDSPIARGRVLVRPSGTEAKLKVYVHLMSSAQKDPYSTSTSEVQELMAQEIQEKILQKSTF